MDLQPELFSRLRVIKLDEWGGLPLDNPLHVKVICKNI
jgi:hypothetical protein